MQPVQFNLRRALSLSFRKLYELHEKIKTKPSDLGEVKVFRNLVNMIAKYGEPDDAIGLLPLIDQSEPMMLRTNQLARAIAILMNKPMVRTQWKKISKFYLNALRKKGDWSLEKTLLSSKDILPKIRKNLSPNDSVHLLGIASFDPDGYLREAALEEMAQLNTGNILPYILLRLNDRAQKNKSLAHKILKTILDNKKVTVNQLVWCRPLIEKAPKEIQANFSNYVQNPNFQAEVKLLLDSHIDEKDKNFLVSICKVADKK